MPAAKIFLLEDGGKPAPNLQTCLQESGYLVLNGHSPLAAAPDEAARLRPDLVVAVLPPTRQARVAELGMRIHTDLGIPVVFLASRAGIQRLRRMGLQDPFSILRWPADGATLRDHLSMVLEKTSLEKQLEHSRHRPSDVAHYHSLFDDSPISLWEEDFSQVKQMVDEIKCQGVEDLRAYFTAHPEAIIACAQQLRVLDVNKATLRMFGASSKEQLLANIDKIFDQRIYGIMLEEVLAIGEGKTEFEGDGFNRDLQGRLINIRLSWSVPPGSEDNLKKVIVSVNDVTEQKRRETMLKVTNSFNATLRGAQTRVEMLPIILTQTAELLGAGSAALILFNADRGCITVELATGEWTLATGRLLNEASSLTEQMIASPLGYSSADILTEPKFPLAELVHQDCAVAAMPFLVQKECIGGLWLGRETPFTIEERTLLAALTEISANIIHHTTLHERTQRYAEQVATVSTIGRALATSLELQDIYDQLSQGVLNLLPGISSIYISTFDSRRKLITYEYGFQDGEKLDLKKVAPIPLDSPLVGSQGEVLRTRQPLILNDLQTRRRRIQTGILIGSPAINTQSGIYIPMLAKDEILGVMYAQSYTPNRFTESDAELLTLVANTSAVAIQNARLFAATQRRVQRLTALHAIDVAISSSLDLRITLNILLDQLIALLHLDAADILLLDGATQTLEYASGRGFRSLDISRVQMKLDEGLPGRAVMDSRIFHVSNLAETQIIDRRYHLIALENFTGYTAAPLIAKGQRKGVLEIFYRSTPEFDPEWQEFLETLAGQVAVAIDNATLVHQLQHTNLELTLAYDTTLECLSRAVDLRDKDTGDHNRRVADLSVRLAKAMGMSDAEIVQIRRGALLHDIGKLGIPDNILGKTGPLTDDERKTMQKHPEYANEMLKDITFLTPARVIPYCHHEKWDGTGYPRGLKGEQIPLAARIFAVVDVWDSLRSNRSYRLAWSTEQAREYIRSHAGTHFDPGVVGIFLDLI